MNIRKLFIQPAGRFLLLSATLFLSIVLVSQGCKPKKQMQLKYGVERVQAKSQHSPEIRK